ncbi:DNA/RNA nuclease SfsA [Dongshaea marina]|uniref:DNA/RNA nuclease SfsA n=1 Tax=Dongshaea marina TaxID=2047966 RepID=UPI000D3E8412|nr:DNA/RNA nuclease SfsA [Dongshaea marina]
MKFTPPLQQGTLIKRYKRFLTDIYDEKGEQLTIHCPNTGAMTGCAIEGSRVWYSESDNPKRKYPHTWELAENEHGVICINTQRANQLAYEGIEQGVIHELSGYSKLQREVKYGEENSRIDLLLSDESRPPCYVEVKSCTLLESDGCGYFPDAVSERGQKHLRELIHIKRQGNRAVLLFVVQHTGITKVRPAAHIDAKYSTLIGEAEEQGVEILCYRAHLEPGVLKLAQSVPFERKNVNSCTDLAKKT